MALIKTSAQGLTADATNFVLLDSASSTTDVSEIVISSVSSAYDEYVLYFNSLPATDDVGLRVRMRSSGSDISSSVYGNAGQRLDSTSRSTHTTDGGNRFEINNNGTQGNQTGETLQSIIRFTNMNSSSFCTSCYWETNVFATAGTHTNYYGSGFLNTNTTVCDGFKLFYGAGNISEYEYRFYGVKK